MTRAVTTLAAGVGLGAALMYFLDPDRGSRRRTHARNQLLHASHRARDSKAFARLRSLAPRGETVDDRVLAERARAMLGHAVSHVHALAIDVSHGVVTVSGPILLEEMRGAITALKRVPGVRRVINALDTHPSPHRMPALAKDPRLAWVRNEHSTGRKVAAAVAGAAGLGLVARAALHARPREFELRP